MIELVLAAATFAAPAELSTRVVDGILEVRGPRALWKKREIHRTVERHVVFVPGASVTALDQQTGGVVLQSYDAKRGAVIVVKPGSTKLADHLRYAGKPKARRKEGASRSEVSALPSPVARDLAAQSKSVREAPGPSPEQKGESSVDGTTSPAEPAVQEPSPPKVGLDRIRSDEDSSLLRTLGVLALLVLLGAVAWWMNRRRGLPDLAGGAIEIVSVKPLGPKHRLAIVEAGGERLLIAASDSEVRLLSSLGYATAQAPILAEAEEDPSPADEHASEDVAGLLRLREESAARDFESVLQSVNPTQYIA